MQPQVIVIERIGEPRSNGSANEIDSRIDAVQREIESALDKTNHRGKKE